MRPTKPGSSASQGEQDAIRLGATNVAARIAGMPAGEVVKQVAVMEMAGGASRQQSLRVVELLVEDGTLTGVDAERAACARGGGDSGS